jgi:hypothetical protein
MSRGRGREKAREYGGTRVRGHEWTARGRLYHRAKRVLTMPVRGVSIGPVLSCVAAAPLRSYPQCSPPLFAPLLLFALFARLCSSLLLAAVRATSRHIAAPLRSSSLLFASLRCSRHDAALLRSSPLLFAPRHSTPLRHSRRVAALLFAIRTAWLRSSSPFAPRRCAPLRPPHRVAAASLRSASLTFVQRKEPLIPDRLLEDIQRVLELAPRRGLGSLRRERGLCVRA